MHIVKKILSGIFGLLLVLLMVAPVYLIVEISQAEMEEYQVPEKPVMREVAVGEIAMAQVADVKEYVTVNGNFVSNTYAYQELSCEKMEMIRWMVNIGEEIQEGQILGSYYGEHIVASVSGILVERSLTPDNAYLRVRLLKPVELECKVDDRVLAMLKRSNALSTEDGNAVKLIYASSVKNQDGTTWVRLTIETEKYTFGQSLSALRIYTGRIFRQTLVLPVNCVYQKAGSGDDKWYARRVSENGELIGEIEVQVGYFGNDVVSVSGIDEGTYYDTGYKFIAEGG